MDPAVRKRTLRLLSIIATGGTNGSAAIPAHSGTPVIAHDVTGGVNDEAPLTVNVDGDTVSWSYGDGTPMAGNIRVLIP